MSRAALFDVPDPAPLLADLLTTVAATLVTRGDGGMEATVVPLLFDPSAGPLGMLSGHVAKVNPLARDEHHGEALVVVTGTQGYITPSWYPSKAEHGKAVPTWDYVTVQASGPLTLHRDAAWLRANVEALTARHEAGRADPWSVDDAPADFVDAMLRGIVGIEIPVERLVGKAKLSQNLPDVDVVGVIAGLRAEATPAGDALADAIEAATDR